MVAIKPVFEAHTEREDAESTERKQSEDSWLRTYLFSKAGISKLVTSTEQYPLQCILHLSLPPKTINSPRSTALTSGFSEAPWRPQEDFENEHIFIAIFEEEKQVKGPEGVQVSGFLKPMPKRTGKVQEGVQPALGGQVTDTSTGKPL